MARTKRLDSTGKVSQFSPGELDDETVAKAFARNEEEKDEPAAEEEVEYEYDEYEEDEEASDDAEERLLRPTGPIAPVLTANERVALDKHIGRDQITELDWD